MSTNESTRNEATETGRTVHKSPPGDELDAITAGEAGAGRLAVLNGVSRLQLDALFALAGEGACSGAAIRDTLDAVYGDDAAVSERLYGHLDDLAERGLLDKQDEGPHTWTNTYWLTTAGRDAIDAYREWAGQCLLPRPAPDADGDDDPPAPGVAAGPPATTHPLAGEGWL